LQDMCPLCDGEGCFTDAVTALPAAVGKVLASEQLEAMNGKSPAPTPPEKEVVTSWAALLVGANAMKSAPSLSESFPEAFVIEGLLSKCECECLVKAAEQHGFGYTGYNKKYRGNLRLLAIDDSLSSKIWERMAPLLPESVELHGSDWLPNSLNDHWRLAKYHPGDRFEKHCDRGFTKSSDLRSMFTVNIYMNDVAQEDGGATRFYVDENGPPALNIQPSTGLALIFRQPPGTHYVHDGEELRGFGVKYLFRSDVFYRRVN